MSFGMIFIEQIKNLFHYQPAIIGKESIYIKIARHAEDSLNMIA